MITYRAVWLIILLFSCCFLATGGSSAETPNTNNVIQMQLEVKNGLPFTKINIGYKKYQLLLSTWFSDFLIFSQSACEAKVEQLESNGELETPEAQAVINMCEHVETYDDSEIKEENKKSEFDRPYLKGKLKGYFIHETVKIHKHKLQQQPIGIITDWPLELAAINQVGQFEGIFGLMFLPTKTNNEGSPFLKTLIKSQKISSGQFGMYLNYARGSGELTLGGINPININNHGDTPLIDIPLVADGTGWLINIDSIKVGTDVLGSNLKAYVDTSSTAFYGKTDIITKINNALQAQEKSFKYKDSKTGENKVEKMWVFSSCWDNPPNVIITISGKEYIVDPSISVINTYWISCTPAFKADDLKDYDLIIGSRFLNKYYSVFDQQKKVIQFAEATSGDLIGGLAKLFLGMTYK